MNFMFKNYKDVIYLIILGFTITSSTVLLKQLIKIATNDKVLSLPNEFKDDVRTRILKNILINLI